MQKPKDVSKLPLNKSAPTPKQITISPPNSPHHNNNNNQKTPLYSSVPVTPVTRGNPSSSSSSPSTPSSSSTTPSSAPSSPFGKKQARESIVLAESVISERQQCTAGKACASTDPLHWVHYQHTPRAVTNVKSDEGQGNDEEDDDDDVCGTTIVHDDDDEKDDDGLDGDGDGSGTMVIRGDHHVLERLHHESDTSEDESSVIVHSSRSEVVPRTTNSPKPAPWLNKYRSPETWERNIIALEKGEFTEDMNEEAFGKYVRNKPRPSAQQLFAQLSMPVLPSRSNNSNERENDDNNDNHNVGATVSAPKAKKRPAARSSPNLTHRV